MNWFDIIVLIVALYSIFKGYRSGFIKQLASLAGLVACVLLSGKLSTILLPYFQDKIPGYFVEPATFIAAFLLIFAAFKLIGHMLQSILESIKIGAINKFAGAILSLAKWMILISVIINLAEKLDSKHTLIPDDLATSSKSYRYVQPIAPMLTPYLKFDLFQKDHN